MFRQFFVVSALVAMCVVLSQSASAQSKEDAMRFFEEAQTFQRTARSATDLQRSTQKYEKALQIFEGLGLKQGVGPTALNLGGVYYALAQYDRSAEYFEKSLQAYREIKDLKGEGQSLNNLGLVFSERGQYDKAAEYYKMSLAISLETKDRRTEGTTLNNLGMVFKNWDRYEKAIEYYEKSLSIFQEFGDRKSEGIALYNMAFIYRGQGQYPKAAENLEKSLKIAEELKDKKAEGPILNGLGVIYTDWGQYAEAIEFYEKSLALAREFKDPKDETQSLANLGRVYKMWGQYDKAVEHYKKSLAIARGLKDRKSEGQSLMLIGEISRDRGEYDKAIEYFKESLTIWTEMKIPTHLPKVLLVDTYIDSGNLANAEPLLNEVKYNTTWGRFYLLRGDYPKAKEYYARLLNSAAENRNAENLFTAYTGLGVACEGMKDDAGAAENYEKAVKLTEEIRSSLSAAERENFFDVKINGFTRTAPYEGLARVQIRLNKPQDAFKTTEYTRARVFAEAMSRLSHGKNLNVPPEIVRQDESINNELVALKKNLQKAYEKNNKLVIQSLQPQIKEKEAQLQNHIKMLRDKYPLFAATKYPQPVDLSQTGLKDNEWVLSYDLTDPGLIIYLTKGKTLVKSLYKPVPRKEIDDLVRKFREPLEIKQGVPIKNRLTKFDFTSGKKLADLLLTDVLPLLPKDTPVIIVPGGSLGIVPFEMLVLNDGAKVATDKDTPYVTGAEFFGDRNPISYYQSVTALTLARTLGKQKSSGEKSLVMDDPIFDTNDSRFKKLASEKRQTDLSAAPDKLLSAIKHEWKNEMVFPRLEGTRDLGDALKKMEPVKTEEYRDIQASKTILFEKPLDRYNSMVFATHGYFGKDLPGIMEPVLVLTLVNQPQGKDGFLRLSEVMGLKLNADMVALTACQTGLGKHISGEGTMGMGRAFQYAGAKSVLMSLWSVSEKASVDLVGNFFRHLKEGKNKLEALKLARDEIRKNGYDHPFYWAPFILVGEVN